MRLKIATTATMLTGVFMMLAWPFLIGRRPGRDAPVNDLKMYAKWNMVYFAVLLIIFFATVVLAWLVLRQTRREFAEQSKENLQNLIQGALDDHGNKKG